MKETRIGPKISGLAILAVFLSDPTIALTGIGFFCVVVLGILCRYPKEIGRKIDEVDTVESSWFKVAFRRRHDEVKQLSEKEEEKDE